MGNFYDKQAKKFGGYAFGRTKPQHTTEYPNGDPEEIFKEKLISVSGKDKICLDIGCGDGKFTFELASYFRNIIGIDNSKGLLEIAENKKKEKNAENISFQFADAKKLPFENEFFDVAFSRRGPTKYKEYFRVLKKGGFYVEIGIGEKDTADLQKTFGRGQMYGKWDVSSLERDRGELKEAGFDPMFLKETFYNEFYRSYEDLNLFLQTVPIFEDFDSVKDEEALLEYCEKYKEQKGIKLERHRIVYLVKK